MGQIITRSFVTLAELEQMVLHCTTANECEEQLAALSPQPWVFRISPTMISIHVRWVLDDPYTKRVELVSRVPFMEVRVASRRPLEGFRASSLSPTTFYIREVGRLQTPRAKSEVDYDPCLMEGRSILMFGLVLLRLLHVKRVELMDAARTSCRGTPSSIMNVFPLSVVRKLAGKPGFYESMGFQHENVRDQQHVEMKIQKFRNMTFAEMREQFPTYRFPSELNEQETVGDFAQRFIGEEKVQKQYCTFFRDVVEDLVIPEVNWWALNHLYADLPSMTLPQNMMEYCRSKYIRPKRKAPPPMEFSSSRKSTRVRKRRVD